MIPWQLLANPGSGGEQDLAPLSLCILLSDGGDCVEPGGGSQEEAGGLGVVSPRCQPKGIWRVNQGGKARGCPPHRGMEMKAFWFQVKEEF